MPEIVMQDVTSSQIAAVGFGKDRPDQRVGTLQVTFIKSGKTWRYFGVPEEVLEDLMSAPSIGSFLNRAIRGHFDGEEVR